MNAREFGPAPRRPLRRGDVVRVRPLDEILATLDAQGDLDGLPFMPEMAVVCGREFVVHARADKTCDTVDLTGCSREMDDTVHLAEARCDGSAHGGCQAGCLLFFKERWLEPAGVKPRQPTPALDPDAEGMARLTAQATVDSQTYRCQATALPSATRPMRGLRHYLRDVGTRNVPWPRFAKAMAVASFDRYQRFSRRRLPSWARIKGGADLPDVRGILTTTPTVDLALQPGDLVEVKALDEIVATLSVNQRNRNLWFDREMIRYCGRRFTVLRRVDRLLDEKTGHMIQTKTPSIILDGVVCVGDYHKLCPREDYAFFREIWLKKVDSVRDDSS